MPSSDSTTSAIFGIISLILGIITFLFSFIPCLGFYAFFPGVIGLGLGITGLVLARRGESEKGMLIAAIILSAIGIGIAMFQYKALHKTVHDFGDAIRENKHRFDTLQQKIDSASSRSFDDTTGTYRYR